ncbi:hypothetical protein RsS62_03070 [Rhizobium dioscoreae]|nr:hypothetical protein RsS62_03070 [Rhizobium dioscoreae]
MRPTRSSDFISPRVDTSDDAAIEAGSVSRKNTWAETYSPFSGSSIIQKIWVGYNE